MKQADRHECESLLSANGYRIVRVGIQDTVAIKGEWVQSLS